MAKHVLQTLLEDAGVTGIRSYSGRGMSGRECLGVQLRALSGIGDILGPLLREIVRDRDPDRTSDAGEVAKAFEDVRTDDLGKGTIIYFPNVPFTDDDSEEE